MSPAHRPAEPGATWSGAQLAHALWLALPPAARGGPDLTAAAAAVKVSPRTVQRWLSGASRPTIEHAAALRDLIAPPAQALRAQADEARWAREAASLIRAARGRGVSPAWRTQGWHRPHLLQVLALPRLQIHRVEVVLADPVKAPTRGAWEVVSSRTYPNRPAALLAKHDLLEQHADRRVRVRPGLISKGQHLCWLTGDEGGVEGTGDAQSPIADPASRTR